MKRVLLLAVLIIATLAGLQPSAGETDGTPAPPHSLAPQRLPGRASATPRPSPTPRAAVPPTPAATPSPAGTAASDCTQIYPLDSVERIDYGETVGAQLEAYFGRPARVGGRPPALRFEAQGCMLGVTLDGDAAQTAELHDYGTLELLLSRYGPPDGAGIAQGNLTLLRFDVAVLLYAAEGIVAIFDVPPEALTRQSPIATLQFRPPYELARQYRRLNLEPVEDWSPPLR